MIRGDTVTLRPITADDIALLEGWWSNPDFGGEYNTFALHHPGSIARNFQEHGYLTDERATLLIFAKDEGWVGEISYRTVPLGPAISTKVYELGITVAPHQRGRGYGAAAQRLLAAYLFATYPIARVQATTDIANIGEQKALERAGFTREGVLRQAQFRAGSWHDLVIYSKLRGE